MNKHVLIIDDHDDTRELLLMVLASSFHCKTASSRDEALATIKSGCVPSCILMDYRMPGMPLETFIDAVKEYNINIVLMTAGLEPVSLADKSGVADCLKKPISPDVLLRTLEKLAGS